ncbi:MAG: glycosyltransferase family 2 protein, partial [Acidimicrobiales bacterium]
REVTLDDPAWRAPGDARDLGRRLQSVTVDGVDVIDRLAGAGIHRLEQDPGDPGKRWRWTTGSTPFYIPLPDSSEGACVLIDGEQAPPGPVVRLINNAGSYLRQDAYLGDHALETPDDGRVDRPAERFAASATALAARASTLARVGLLAAPYFAYYEDSDWSWRARLAGMRLVYDPTSTVEHRRGATSGGVADPRVRLLAERNRLLTAVRNAPLPVAARLVRERLEAGPDQGIRRALLRRLGWAAGTRLQMRRRWKLSPEEVWGRWAGADVTWDVTPARTGGW